MGTTDRIEIVPYREEWPNQFQQAKHLLATTLQGLHVSIDHIGSTSVPGLRAKDRIDIQITVRETFEELKSRIDQRLVASGFPPSRHNEDHRPPHDDCLESDWRKLYISGVHPELPFRSNIHVRKLSSRNWRYPLLFRDYLREHPQSAEAYARVKEKLALYLVDNRDAYTDAKDPVCDLLMVEAEGWAGRTGWLPVLSDGE